MAKEPTPTLNYLRTIPKRVPEGKIVVHNRVKPRVKLGAGGFRAWLADPSSKYKPCPCPWAQHLGTHYLVKGVRGWTNWYDPEFLNVPMQMPNDDDDGPKWLVDDIPSLSDMGLVKRWHVAVGYRLALADIEEALPDDKATIDDVEEQLDLVSKEMKRRGLDPEVYGEG